MPSGCHGQLHVLTVSQITCRGPGAGGARRTDERFLVKMFRPSRTVTAGTAAVVVAAAGATGVGLFSPASAADVPLEKSFDYQCVVEAGGLDLGNHTIGVLAETTVPESVYPGQVISERPVNI